METSPLAMSIVQRIACPSGRSRVELLTGALESMEHSWRGCVLVSVEEGTWVCIWLAGQSVSAYDGREEVFWECAKKGLV